MVPAKRLSNCVFAGFLNVCTIQALASVFLLFLLAFCFAEMYLILFMNSALVFLSHHFSPPTLSRHNMTNVCSLLVTVLVVSSYLYPYNITDFMLKLNIPSLMLDLIF